MCWTPHHRVILDRFDLVRSRDLLLLHGFNSWVVCISRALDQGPT